MRLKAQVHDPNSIREMGKRTELPLYPVLQEILKDDSPQRGNNGRSGGGLNTDLRIRVSPPIRSRREGFHLELLARKCSKLMLTFA